MTCEMCEGSGLIIDPVQGSAKKWPCPTCRPDDYADAENSTPSSRWHENGGPDPHGTRYNCERRALCMGNLSDDELANAGYIYNHRQGLESINYLTAMKDRIRWLSRALEKEIAKNR